MFMFAFSLSVSLSLFTILDLYISEKKKYI